MALDSKSGNTVLRLWLLLHRVRDGLVLCEDSVFGEYGLTTEKYSVLAAVKSRGGSLKPGELGEILARSPNSMSMLVDRMVKAGWVRRTRDRKDRRVVNVSLTSKGEKAVGPAAQAGWEFIQKVLSPLSDEDKRVLNGMLEVVKCEIDGCLHPEADMAEIVKSSYTKRPGLYEKMLKNILPLGSEAEHKGRGKRKTVR
jgi:DNA-binding MarR family transcriptional regulator